MVSHFSPEQTRAVAYLVHHGYFAMFIAMLFEGPVTTYVAALAVYMGFFDWYWVIVLSVFGDLAADLVGYAIGRFFSSFFENRFPKFSASQTTIGKLKRFIIRRPILALSVIKVTPPITFLGLMTAGAVKELSFVKFIAITGTITVIISAATFVLGYYSGIPIKMFSSYMKTYQIVSTVGIFIFFFWFFHKKVIKRLTTGTLKRKKYF